VQGAGSTLQRPRVQTHRYLQQRYQSSAEAAILERRAVAEAQESGEVGVAMTKQEEVGGEEDGAEEEDLVGTGYVDWY
jgi:hypothetical protein